MEELLRDPKDMQMISVSRLHSQYAHFIETHKEFCIPYHPYKESCNTFEDMVVECLSLLAPECSTQLLFGIADEVAAHPYTKRAIVALLSVPIALLDNKYHENIARVVQLVSRFCICNGYCIYLNKYIVRHTGLNNLTDKQLSESVHFYPFQ